MIDGRLWLVGFVRARPGACRGPQGAARSGSRGGRFCRSLSLCARVEVQANPGVCLQCQQSHALAGKLVHSHSTEADLTPTLHTLTLKSGFYFLQSLRRGARWGPTQRSPMVSVSFGSRYWVRYPSQPTYPHGVENPQKFSGALRALRMALRALRLSQAL